MTIDFLIFEQTRKRKEPIRFLGYFDVFDLKHDVPEIF